jgi:hypothetical protein
MKHKLLLSVFATLFLTTLYSQKKSKDGKITAYAITAPQKGQNNWGEVRLVDVTTGETIKTVYQSSDQIEILNARTGKAVTTSQSSTATQAKIVVNLDQELAKSDPNNQLQRIYIYPAAQIDKSKPFATYSAACAYDKKHDRFYYTPLGINQLRYIDLSSKNPRIYYFEDENFGVVKGLSDVGNQIPRMVIASDGNGYALSNNGEHLVRFTTGKRPEISDLGALTDDQANGRNSIHNPASFGGDMIADASGSLYLISANHSVFKIDISSKLASFQGNIKGLPAGYSTNGAIVESGSKIIVNSANSTQGYFRFDLLTLQAEKVSSSESVYNASDLANGNLAFEKKKKQDQVEPIATPVQEIVSRPSTNPQVQEELSSARISVYPNPVTNGSVRLLFENQTAGRYQVQFMDIAGKLISAEPVTVANKMQVQEFKLPSIMTNGNYLIKIVDETNKTISVNKLVVQ